MATRKRAGGEWDGVRKKGANGIAGGRGMWEREGMCAQAA